MTEQDKLRIVGAGGHAKVAAEAWRTAGGTIAGFHDDDPDRIGMPFFGSGVLGPVAQAGASGDLLHIAIGNNAVRRRLADQLREARFVTIIHRSAIASSTASVGDGTLVAAGAILQADCRIGDHAIINTAAVIEHDNRIGSFVHIAPGARLGGEVTVQEDVLIGTGAVVLPGLTIGAGALIGAGAVVLHDIAPGARVAGNPARPLPSSAAGPVR